MEIERLSFFPVVSSDQYHSTWDFVPRVDDMDTVGDSAKYNNNNRLYIVYANVSVVAATVKKADRQKFVPCFMY